MSFGRWLLTHSLSLFLALMLLVAWYWRDELQLDRAWLQLQQQAGLSETKTEEQQPPQTQAPSVDEADRPATTDEPVTGPEAETASTPEKSAENPPPEQVADTATGSPPDASSPPAGGKDSPPSSGDSLLLSARKAFWSRDFDRAIALYQSLIEQNPDNPDYLGELGNIYYNLNRFDRAAEMFQQAGKLLVRQGDLARARQLLPELLALDPERGRQLQQALESATAKGGQPQT